MRTTTDLPDNLLRQVKARAAIDGLKLKDLIIHYVEQGLKQGSKPVAGGSFPRRQRSPLPVIERAATGKPISALSCDDLARLELEDDLAKHDRSARR